MEAFKLLLKDFVENRGLIKYQIDSYNDFVENRLQKIFDEIKEINPQSDRLRDFKVKLGKIRIGKPSIKEADGSIREILPMEARLRDLTYAAPLFLEMTPVIGENEQETTEVKIGELPVMVKSSLCPLSKMSREELIAANEDPDDPGGYFIINGTERVLTLIEEIAPNKVIVEMKGSEAQARITSERRGWGQKHLITRRSDGVWNISFASLRKFPVSVLLRALGLDSDKDIIDAIGAPEKYNEEVYVNLYEADVTNTEEALEYIGRKMKVYQKEYRKERAQQIIDKYLLPHIGQSPEDRIRKAKYLSRIILKLMMLAHGDIEEDDIDHYSNKRLKTSGDLLEILIRSILLGKWGLIERINYNYQKIAKRGKIPSVSTVVESNVLTSQINSALATGLWVGGRTGVSQRLERTNFTRSLAHLRNVLSPLSTTQEHFKARELHATHWGRLDPSETPEGPTIGLRKYLAMMAEITTGLSPEKNKKIIEFLEKKVRVR
ncbi:MAG: DNA-directed RNA polymerase subunit B'' [Candidatus Aenigmarchaeota archaeon]|nr:DNA-directed RNA polymerase subunit B'' [Candidatus Aenigmarchaeota archaeon]